MTIDGVPLVMNAGDMTHLLLDVLLVILIFMVRHTLNRLSQLEELCESLEKEVFKLQIDKRNEPA